MRKIKLLFIVIMFSIITTFPVFSTGFGGGTGSFNNPYQIWTLAHLKELADSVIQQHDSWSYMKHFKLMNDITDSVRFMIGDGQHWIGIRSFLGDFNGNNKKITLAIDVDAAGTSLSFATHCGLFAYTIGARIYDLSVDGYIHKDSTGIIFNMGGWGAGGIVGLARDSEFINCVNYANITGLWACVGGIARRSNGSRFINCMNAKNINAYRIGGGIVGNSCPKTIISHCINIGSVSAPDAGGIVGRVDIVSDINPDGAGYTISFCINAGFISGSGNVGGITGANRNQQPTLKRVRNCLNTGVIFSNGSVGGISSWGRNLQSLNNHYDKQMCIYGGIANFDRLGQAEGHLTNEMTGRGLADRFGDVEWVYADNLYPTLKGFEDHPIAMIARSPAYLDDRDKAHFDRQNNVRKCFLVNIENNVKWSNEFDRVYIMPLSDIYDEVWLERVGIDTLFAGIGAERKTVPIRVAQLKPCRFILTLEANPAEAATLVGAGEYGEDETAIYQAIPNECYRFIGWRRYGGIGEPFSTELTDSVIMDASYHFVAHFVRDTFELLTIANPEEGGSVEGGGLFDCGEWAIYSAIPNECYIFINWTDSASGDTVSTKLIDTIAMKQDWTLIANFVRRDTFDLTLKVNPVGSGTVEKEVVCITAIYSAIPNDCWRFINWTDSASGDTVSTQLIDTFEMLGARTLIANFVYGEFELLLSARPAEGGEVKGAGEFPCNELATYSAEPNDCWRFINWTDAETDEVVSPSLVDSLIMTKDFRLIANFERDASFNLTTKASPEEGGTVTEKYIGCSTVVYSAIQEECYRFINWIDEATGKIVSEKQTDTLELFENRTLVANFIYGEFELLLIKNPPEGGTVIGGGEFPCNEIVTYRAEPNECWRFINWTDAETDEVVSPSLVDSLIMTKDFTLIANFARDNIFNLTTKANSEEGGTVTENYVGCSTVVFTATPNECYRLVSWMDAKSGAIISTKLIDTIDLFEDREFIANFEYFIYDYNLSSSLHLNGNQLSANHLYTLGSAFPKLKIALNSNASEIELNKITELNINFDYCNVFARVNPNSLKLLDLNGWIVTNSQNTFDINSLTSNYSVTLSNSAGLPLANNIELFEIEIQMALPTSDRVKKIEDDYYKLLISPVFSVQGTTCLTKETDASQLNIAPICVIDYMIFSLSDVNFGLEIIDNIINYSVGFDCDASLTIYNSLGQAILVPVSGTISKGDYSFDISDFDFPTGSYFCELIINGVYRKVVGIMIVK